MKRTLTGIAVTLLLGLGISAHAAVTGQWDFNNGDLAATVGVDLSYRGDTAATTSFTTMTIGGESANVMAFPATTPTQGYVMTHGMAPNGGSTTYVNQWSLIMDIMFPLSSDSAWRALLQTNEGNSNDGDLFINPSNGIGFGGVYQGSFTADVWHRVAFVVDASSATSANNSVRKFIDGTLVGVNTGISRDGTFGLDPTALLFTDNDNETKAGYVNSIQIIDTIMSDSYISGLGGATAAGIPAIPEPASGLLLLAGLTLLGGLTARRRR
jgi:hypothetical protein